MAKVFKGITLKRKKDDNEDYYADSEIYYYYYASGKFTFRLYKGYIKPGELLLDLIYSDIIKLISFNNFNKIRYYILFRDDIIIILKVYLIIYKSEVFEKLRYFKIKYK